MLTHEEAQKTVIDAREQFHTGLLLCGFACVVAAFAEWAGQSWLPPELWRLIHLLALVTAAAGGVSMVWNLIALRRAHGVLERADL